MGDDENNDNSSSNISDDPGTAASSGATAASPEYLGTSPTAAPCSTVNVTAASTNVSSDDEADDEEVRHACEKAEEVYEFVTLPHKTCHCKCQLNDGKRCIDQFNPEDQDAIKINACEMTSYEKDLLLLGIISCSINATDSTLSKKQKNVARKKTRVRHFLYNHQRICRDTFIYLVPIALLLK